MTDYCRFLAKKHPTVGISFSDPSESLIFINTSSTINGPPSPTGEGLFLTSYFLIG